MSASPKALLAAAFVALALIVGLGFHLLAPDDDGAPPVDATARAAALRAEASRDRAVDRILGAAPVIGDALGSGARVVERTAWFRDGKGAPIGEVVLVTFPDPIDLPASYRKPVDDGAASGGAFGSGGRIATEPIPASEREGVGQLVALVDVERGTVHAVSRIGAAAATTTTGAAATSTTGG
ncbi:hypothetical protein KSP35_17995 [Aquihabitans sp. G128]|uniref:hypothetical protein n=1 Tax=Aquihabitans sp. G128 TaxID=2849779 RepID=UPI001C2132FD|nr:hypothetical protein [Aquihabitans sp. G128]QXC60221.1 hypothetical protein KSP35_17995 [Aquihabitans sp. G128]